MNKDFNGYRPSVNPAAYVSPQALLIGKVTLASQSSVWPGAVLRGDIEDIIIGKMSNVQDGSLMHTSPELPVLIGEAVTIGHGAVLHGCRIGDRCLIGMGAVVLDGAIIGAGCVVPENTHIPDRSMVLGVPGKIVRAITDEEVENIKENAREYWRLAEVYKQNVEQQQPV